MIGIELWNRTLLANLHDHVNDNKNDDLSKT
jgi:hypothetical protein